MKTYEKLVAAAATFRTEVFDSDRSTYRSLSQGQNPVAAFVGCSDSRVIPNLLTGTAPGELFVVRNAGNFIAGAEHAAGHGEAASLEYAVSVLAIRHIIICGHTGCGAIGHLLKNSGGGNELPFVNAWVRQAEELNHRLGDKVVGLSDEARGKLAVQENVRLQLEHLRTYPFVQRALDLGRLVLHGWVYSLDSGEVLTLEPGEESFAPLRSSRRTAEASARLVLDRKS